MKDSRHLMADDCHRLADDAGVDMILVGDSVGMVVLGQKNTVGVTMDDVCNQFDRIVMKHDIT